ncbi:aminotransferase class V-fold PLP-dependent enzyme [Sabulicella rubraurantiaca]|uniref:aminotransferase class V-fold PLP-dependent enzyme n=1 Tax=Sabulicella rubraurantiaca TaxID=2811429 RepID=UPI001A975B70|nr:aminotransferase class V-fold PLP-dependent enzyme [Sabulicella rubraurantiaca]
MSGAVPLPAFRAAFPGLSEGRGAYLDTAHKGLLPGAAHAALLSHLEETVRGVAEKSHLIEIAEETRDLFARLVGVEADEIAITKNVSEGVNTFANAVDWRPGDEVVLCPGFEHPNNLLPWLNLRRRGVSVVEVPIRADHALPVEGIAAAIRPARTRVVTVSAASFTPGCRADLRAVSEACRPAGALLHVDGAQSVGVLRHDLRVEGVDALSVGGQKALCGLFGFGFLYVRRAVAEALDPPFLARFGVRQEGGHEDFSPGVEERPAAGARRFDVGYPGFTGGVAMRECLRLLLATGPEAIEARALFLSAQLADALDAAGLRVIRVPDHLRTHIVAADVPGGGAAALHAHLAAQGVRCSYRKGGLRLSVHAYTDEAEIARAAEACAAWIRQEGVASAAE